MSELKNEESVYRVNRSLNSPLWQPRWTNDERVNQNGIHKTKYQMQIVNTVHCGRARAWTLSPKMENIWVKNSKLKHNKCCFGESDSSHQCSGTLTF